MKQRLFFLICFIIITSLRAEQSVRPVLLVIGTRPEAIKMIPLYQALKHAQVPVVLCSTGQHAQMLDDVLSLFGVCPDIALHIMKQGQDLFYLTTTILATMKEVLMSVQPTLVVVQGDTTTALASTMAAFYLKIPVAHVEAGLRSGNIYGPFPEEFNRKSITVLASYHFAPTHSAYKQLIAEQVNPDTCFYTGNTVVDALHIVLQKIRAGTLVPSHNLVSLMTQKKAEGCTIIVLTAHRRESFDGGLDRIFNALKKMVQLYPQLCVVYPVHPNPSIKEAIARTQLDCVDNIMLMSPLVYHDLLYVLDACDGVATDSGGITEEAVSIGKPVIMLRNETDRPEGIEQGLVKLVGTDEQAIVDGMTWMLTRGTTGSGDGESPYGDGHACERIVNIIKEKIYQGEL